MCNLFFHKSLWFAKVNLRYLTCSDTSTAWVSGITVGGYNKSSLPKKCKGVDDVRLCLSSLRSEADATEESKLSVCDKQLRGRSGVEESRSS